MREHVVARRGDYSCRMALSSEAASSGINDAASSRSVCGSGAYTHKGELDALVRASAEPASLGPLNTRVGTETVPNPASRLAAIAPLQRTVSSVMVGS